ncbi:hybrid signal transduction histidine kinase M [Tanacetum coccineum]
MPAVQADFFRKKSRNAAVQAVYKKNCSIFPNDMSLEKIPLKDKILEVKSVEKSNSKGIFPSDMSLGKRLYDVDKYLTSPNAESGTSSSAPFTPKELKVDKIMLSWILFTLSDSLCAGIVVARPKSAKEAWSLISDIVKDNKRSRTNTLKAELRSIKLGDQSMESYFQKIDSIVNILTSLDARVNEEDVVHYAFEGHTTKFVATCIGRTPFPISKLCAPCKPWKPCFNFAKGNYRYGDSCRYVHDANARVPNATSGFNKGRRTSKNSTNELLNKLLA